MDSKHIRIADLPVFMQTSKEPPIVSIYGWLQNVRVVGKKVFYVIRDGSGFLQAVASPQEYKGDNFDQLGNLFRETSVEVQGKIKPDSRAPFLGLEMSLFQLNVIGLSSPDIESEYRPDSTPDVLMDKRHLVIRGQKTSNIIRVKSIVTQALRNFFYSRYCVEVHPPTIVQTQVEGGSTLFKLKYFDQDAYLTQSSQLYLETVIFALRDVFCILPSYRAEKSRTRRHLTEYTHVEGEFAFMDFEGLLEFLESMVRYVIKETLEKAGDIILSINPSFKLDEKPFLRITYEDAIRLLNEHHILNDDEQPFKLGDEINEKPERLLIDTLGHPTFLMKFPTKQKAFYMKRDPNNLDVTFSADLLAPTVGEIVGGSEREDNMDRLLERIHDENLDTSSYYWYLDTRKYGSVPHSGFGLGLERFLMYILGLEHIRDACLYPRLQNRATP